MLITGTNVFLYGTPLFNGRNTKLGIYLKKKTRERAASESHKFFFNNPLHCVHILNAPCVCTLRNS